MLMPRSALRSALALSLSVLSVSVATAADSPLKALLITGGCCHDYAHQHIVLSEGIQSMANVQVDVVHSEDRGTDARFPMYENPDWAKGYDVVIHDECTASIKDLDYVRNIVGAHRSVPAVNLHCAMHSYRTGDDTWFEFVGLQSSGHGPQQPIAIRYVDSDHPATKGLADWTTINEELYNNLKVFDSAHVLARGTQVIPGKDGAEPRTEEAVVTWANDYHGTRIFNTTIGHNTETVADERYLELVTRGLLWACGKLDDPAAATPFSGNNEITILPAPAKEETPAPAPPKAEAGTVKVTLTASSEESAKSNFAWMAMDGDPQTRWCASSADFPQWLQLEFANPQPLTGIDIQWESTNNQYQHTVEVSDDGKSWNPLPESAKPVRFLRISCTGTSAGGWASIREITPKGDGLPPFAPALSENQQAAQQKAQEKAADPYAKAGNVPPAITVRSPEEEAEILKDVTVAEGFDVSLFAAPPAANYPVFVAAAPDGTLFVSSDGNGSLGRSPERGRILRLRDTDGDGRADQVTTFAENLDSPRGLLWDHDRLYVVHPPDLSVFIDSDGDGVSDKKKRWSPGSHSGLKTALPTTPPMV
ncbi:hypothetical protein BH23VER1_BH23VER1_00510 [soil metagenome]